MCITKQQKLEVAHSFCHSLTTAPSVTSLDRLPGERQYVEPTHRLGRLLPALQLLPNGSFVFFLYRVFEPAVFEHTPSELPPAKSQPVQVVCSAKHTQVGMTNREAKVERDRERERKRARKVRATRTSARCRCALAACSHHNALSLSSSVCLSADQDVVAQSVVGGHCRSTCQVT